MRFRLLRSVEAKEAAGQAQPEAPKYTQKDLDDFAAKQRYAYEKEKSTYLSELEDLKKFRQEHSQAEEAKKQQDLEAQQKYEESKKMWVEKENTYKTQLTEYQKNVNSMKIDFAIKDSVMKLNAYPEAADLLKSMANIDEKGNITIRGKYQAGFETPLSVEEGIKQFLKDRPHLVKVQTRQGGGTGTAQPAGTEINRDLAGELQEAMRTGDRKKALELKQAIRAKHRGVSSGGITILAR